MKQITVFAKRRQSADGRTFYNYLTSLTTKDGEVISAAVKFKENPPSTDALPANILIDETTANLATRVYEAKNGDLRKAYTLWITTWTMSAEKWEDHSLDNIAW